MMIVAGAINRALMINPQISGVLCNCKSAMGSNPSSQIVAGDFLLAHPIKVARDTLSGLISIKRALCFSSSQS
jgi:hypothetical protein